MKPDLTVKIAAQIHLGLQRLPRHKFSSFDSLNEIIKSEYKIMYFSKTINLEWNSSKLETLLAPHRFYHAVQGISEDHRVVFH